MNFLNNQFERQIGMDMNGDGYIGGQGLESRLERATHIDFNGNGIIGRLPDTYPGGGAFPPMNFGNNYGYFPPTGYGGFPPTGYGGFPPY